MASVKVYFLKPGMLTTVQDGGRPGFQKYGVPKSGALDNTAMQLANWLVGNELAHPVLEITMIGPVIEFDNACQIALTGADLSPKINGEGVLNGECLVVKKGDVISFGKLKTGCRGYLAIGGQWSVRQWLGSKSAVILPGEKIMPNSIIKKGSVLEIETRPSATNRKLPFIPLSEITEKIKVIKGPEFELFSNEFIGYFFSRVFKVSAESNRMGYRLEKKITGYKADAIISSGIIPGTIQITPSGQPVVLLSDAQTIGGYPRIANVISAHLDLLAQLKPGDDLSFELVDLKTAHAATEEKNKKIEFLK